MIPPSLAAVEEVITEIQSAGIQLHYKRSFCVNRFPQQEICTVFTVMFIHNSFFFSFSAPEWPVIR